MNHTFLISALVAIVFGLTKFVILKQKELKQKKENGNENNQDEEEAEMEPISYAALFRDCVFVFVSSIVGLFLYDQLLPFIESSSVFKNIESITPEIISLEPPF